MRPFAAFVLAMTPRGHVLVVQDRERGYWMLPGGGIEPGETPDAAARREFFEETGMVLGGDLAMVESADVVLFRADAPRVVRAAFARRTDWRETSDYAFVDPAEAVMTARSGRGRTKRRCPTVFRRHTPRHLRLARDL
jgi:8-oxo-dGTP pyrophosphatase MutT (NUDIX family)